MDLICENHLERPAYFKCDSCNSYFCPECVLKESGDKYTVRPSYICPKCNHEARFMGVSQSLPPFWERLPEFFIYPFRRIAPMAIIAAVALCHFIMAKPFLSHKVILLFIWLFVIKYSYSAMLDSMKGTLVPPKLSYESLFDHYFQVFKQAGVFILAGLFFALSVSVLGRTAGFMLFSILLLFVPAMLIILVISNRLLVAVNPVNFIGLARRIGWAYLVMLLFLMFLEGAPAILIHMAKPHLPENVIALISAAANSYYTIISYHLMGYVMLQYHDRVGLTVNPEDFIDPSMINITGQDDEDTKTLQNISSMIVQGDIDPAMALVRNKIKTDGVTSLNTAERYYSLLKLHGSKDEALEVGTEYLKLLIDKKDSTQAIDVYIDCSKHDRAEFEMAPGQLYQLGQWLAACGMTSDAIGVLEKIAVQHPGDAFVPQAFFKLATIYKEYLNDEKTTRNILNLLIEKFSGHAIASKAEKYLAQMDHLVNKL